MPDQLRETFGEVAEEYDRVRPGYSQALFDDLASLADLRPGARVLEIGCGTGQATRPLLERGYSVTAVELSPDLATVARRKLSSFSDLHIEVGDFESWPLPAERFDLVVSAQAFHWVDPSIRLIKTVAALHDGGRLALFGHEHVEGGDSEFFAQAQDCYERFMPGTPPGLRLTAADALPYVHWDLEHSGLFEAPEHRRYPFVVEYTAAEYLAVLSTYSGHRALSPDARADLFNCIERLIVEGLGGRVRKAYLTELAVARKKSR
jgi:SAM-dependent methyltransferase